MLRRSCSQVLKFRQRIWPGATTSIQQKREEHILRRMHPPPVPDEGEEDWRLYDKEPDGVPGVTHSCIDWAHVWDDDYWKYTKKGDEFVYLLEKDTNDDPVGDIDVILCWDIEGLGLAGEQVRVNRDLARKQLITLGGAVYVTPENIEKYKLVAEANAERRAKGEDHSVPEDYDRIIKMLQAICLPVPMNREATWTLSKSHVRVALRRQGMWIPEENIELPEKEINNKSRKDFKITVNLYTRGGAVHASIPVTAQIVDHTSPEARATPFAQTFQYKKKTITDVILEKYREVKAQELGYKQASSPLDNPRFS